jgi:hypothetical protein
VCHSLNFIQVCPGGHPSEQRASSQSLRHMLASLSAGCHQTPSCLYISHDTRTSVHAVRTVRGVAQSLPCVKELMLTKEHPAQCCCGLWLYCRRIHRSTFNRTRQPPRSSGSRIVCYKHGSVKIDAGVVSIQARPKAARVARELHCAFWEANVAVALTRDMPQPLVLPTPPFPRLDPVLFLHTCNATPCALQL